jgi:HNH endonuclease
LLKNKDYIGRVVHKYGSGGRSIPWVRQLYQRIFTWINDGLDETRLLEMLARDNDFAFLTMADPLSEGQSRGNAGEDFSRNTKSAAFLKEALDNAIKCKICGGLLHVNSITVDHVHRRAEGGSSAVENAQVSHPYCNTTYKN